MFTGVVATLFFIHGLITMGNGFGAVLDGGRKAWADPGLANAAWLSWWPLNLGRSWFIDAARTSRLCGRRSGLVDLRARLRGSRTRIVRCAGSEGGSGSCLR